MSFKISSWTSSNKHIPTRNYRLTIFLGCEHHTPYTTVYTIQTISHTVTITLWTACVYHTLNACIHHRPKHAHKLIFSQTKADTQLVFARTRRSEELTTVLSPCVHFILFGFGRPVTLHNNVTGEDSSRSNVLVLPFTSTNGSSSRRKNK